VYIYIGIGVVALVVVVVVLIATRPAIFRIQRSGQVAAPPEVVFAILDDFHLWAQWSPWEKLDPDMKKTFEGPAAGPGAIYAWVGNKKVGEGRMTSLESKRGQVVAIRLEFFKPFAANNTARFTLTPANGGTFVNWSMEGKNKFRGKAFSMVMNMDKMVGKDFERGLANLNVAAQARLQAASA
jgi:hypothetical protein